MSLSWTFLTKSFLPLRYRDMVATIIIGKFAFGKFIQARGESNDNDFVMQRVYTHDESNIQFREAINMTDGAVRRDKQMAFAKRIREQRAKNERAMMLDAYNYLYGKKHTLPS